MHLKTGGIIPALVVPILAVGAAYALDADRNPFPATLVLAQHREFSVSTRQASGIVEQHFAVGDTVTIDFANSVFTINGVAYMPEAPEPPKDYPLDELRAQYGRVPMVRHLVAGDSMSPTRWNSAVRKWETAYTEVLLESQRLCRDLVHHGMPIPAAEDSSLSWLRRSTLIEFAGRRSSDPHSSRAFHVRAAGLGYEAVFGFPLEEPAVPRTMASCLTRREAEAQLESLRQLLTGDPGLQVTVEYRFGRASIKSSGVASPSKGGKP